MGELRKRIAELDNTQSEKSAALTEMNTPFVIIETHRRSAAFRLALRLQVLTLAWMVVEAGASFAAGAVAGSLRLVAFGIDSVIELISAFVVFRRLRRESTGLLDAEGAERNASRVAGYLLYALSVYIVLQAVYGLLHRHKSENSYSGIGIAVVAAFGMPLLAKAKLRVASDIESKALRADAMETLTCGYLAWVLLAGLVAKLLGGWWWVDSVASLVIVPFLIREAKEAISGEDCCTE